MFIMEIPELSCLPDVPIPSTPGLEEDGQGAGVVQPNLLDQGPGQQGLNGWASGQQNKS